MAENPKPAAPKAATAKADKAAAITPHRLESEAAIDPRRAAPASLLSVTFHIALVALFALLTPATIMVGGATEKVEGVVTTEPTPADDAADRFRSTDENSNATETGGRDVNFDVERIAPNSIGGEVIPEDAVGNGGAERAAMTIPPAPSFGTKVGQGATATEAALGNAEHNNGQADGYNVPYPKAPGSIYGRSAATRQRAVDIGIATTKSEAAVTRGLRWLARVQSADGRWKLDGNFPDKGNPNDAAGTALGVLPFLAAGFTHRPSKVNDFDKPIDKAIKYLVSIQDKKTGSFARDMYAHGICTIAICEAFGLSQDYALRKPAQLAIGHIVAAQHAGGGWRYQPGQAGDTSVSGWQIMALKSGLMAGLEVPPGVLRKAQNYLDTVNEQATEGYGYIGTQGTPTMSAVSLLCRQYLQGWGPQNLRMIKGIDNWIKPNYPKADRKDIYYYYYATQVMHHFGGTDWKAWNVQMRDQLVAEQAKSEADLTTWGSWSPQRDTWGRTGGRLMQTSLSLLTLEVYYRYLPLYYRDTGAAAMK